MTRSSLPVALSSRGSTLARSARLGATAAASVVVVVALFEGAHPWPSLLLGAAAGALLGLVLGALALLSRRVSIRLSSGVFVAVGISAGLWAAHAIGAFSKLSSSRAALAWLALLGGIGGGALLGALAANMRLDRADVGRLPRRRLSLAASALALGALLAVVVEKLFVLSGYPAAQDSLAAASWLLVMVALRSVDPWPKLPTRARRVLGGALSLATLLGALALAPSPPDPSTFESPELTLPLAILGVLTDFDGDGASGYYGGGDCAPLDPDVHPGALEIPGNGVDDNCLAGDAPSPDVAVAVEARQVAAPTDSASSSLVLITIDALRPDHTTPYGYSRDTTPNLARFATGARRFTRVTTSGGFTSLALSSMMRGVYPRRIRWQRAFETSRGRLVASADAPLEAGESLGSMFTLPLRDEHPSLPALLTSRGLSTLAVVDDGSSSFLAEDSGLAPGFQTYVLVTPSSTESGDEAVAREVVSRLPQLASPFFLWVHLFGPHLPNESHPGDPDFGDDAVDRYDGEIFHADRALGEILAAVDARTMAESLSVIITADHGEVFGGGTRGHGLDLFEGGVAVPLLARGAGFVAGVEPARVSLVDVMPTALALTSTAAPPGLDGVDLRTPSADRVVFTDLWRFDSGGAPMVDLAAASDARHHLIYDLRRAGALLNRVGDLARPPAEVHVTEPRHDLERALNRYLESTGGRPQIAD